MDTALTRQANQNGSPTTEQHSSVFSTPSTPQLRSQSGLTSISSSLEVGGERSSKTLEYIAKSMKVEQPKLVNLGEG